MDIREPKRGGEGAVGKQGNGEPTVVIRVKKERDFGENTSSRRENDQSKS